MKKRNALETAINLNAYLAKKMTMLERNQGLINCADDAFSFVRNSLTKRELSYFKKQMFIVIESKDDQAFSYLNKVNNLFAHCLIYNNK